MSDIVNIEAYEMLDSRGNPTVRAEVFLSDGEKAIPREPSERNTSALTVGFPRESSIS
jgi:enolase